MSTVTRTPRGHRPGAGRAHPRERCASQVAALAFGLAYSTRSTEELVAELRQLPCADRRRAHRRLAQFALADRIAGLRGHALLDRAFS